MQQFSFQQEQFDRLFPFFILADRHLIIQAYGTSLEKIFPDLKGEKLTEHITVSRPSYPKIQFEDFKALTNQIVILECGNAKKTTLRGQVEIFEHTNQVLFIGSPWFASIEEVTENKLTLHDFAYHDPMIDLLHVLKTQEITNEDLKELVKRVKIQEKILQKDQEELERLSMVAKENESGIVFTDRFGKVYWCNEGLEKITGFSKEEIIGKTPVELFKGPITDRRELRNMIEGFENNQSILIELIYYRKDGSWFWGRTKGQPIQTKEGETHFFAMIEDISAEKAAMIKIKEYESQLKMALTNVGDNFWEHNFLTNKTFFSNPNNILLGFELTNDMDLAAIWWDRIYPDDKHIIENNDRAYKEGLIEQHSFEYRMIHKNGSICWVLDRGMVTEKDASGKPIKIIGTHIDITTQKELELELLQKAKQFKFLSENIPGVIYEYEFRNDGAAPPAFRASPIDTRIIYIRMICRKLKERTNYQEKPIVHFMMNQG